MTTPTHSPELLPEPVRAQAWRVVRIAAMDEGAPMFLGCGFALVRGSRTFVITNRHVARAKHIEAYRDTDFGSEVMLLADFGPPIEAHKATIWHEDAAHDLAILSLPDLTCEGGDHSETGLGVARVGQTAYTIGYDDNHIDLADRSEQRGVIHSVGWWSCAANRWATTPHEGAVPAIVVAGFDYTTGASGNPIFDGAGRLIAYGIAIMGNAQHQFPAGAYLGIRMGKALQFLTNSVGGSDV